ncbi:hypothetical protein [Xylocopilactobacillus apis]|uniref:DUF4345 domain-containing protein n=1 Tax=Xylocopilactobacillus apis TaxID=2932183 RepID=A0AAU9D3P1_9LACO|nr:hypothetical protein [Xylocopilactobacillus apis]BDR56945.1 hypothetical protein KIMC2_15070 [Xylocopilactobacillus apis]
MNKFLRFTFIIAMLGIAGAAIIQIFMPKLLGETSQYGLSIYWQREIGFWNLAILPILIGVNYKYDYFFIKIVVLSLIIGGIGFGTNHLLGFLANNANYSNLVGSIENYVLVIMWIIGLKIEQDQQINN